MIVSKEQQITDVSQLVNGNWYCCFEDRGDYHADGEIVQFQDGAFYDENDSESESAMQADFWVKQA